MSILHWTETAKKEMMMQEFVLFIQLVATCYDYTSNLSLHKPWLSKHHKHAKA